MAAALCEIKNQDEIDKILNDEVMGSKKNEILLPDNFTCKS